MTRENTPDTPAPGRGGARDPADRRLQRLRDKYARDLPTKVTALSHAIQDGLRGVDRADKAQEVHLLAHRLHGSAGTYGFGEAATAGASIEAIAQEMLRNENANDDLHWQRLDAEAALLRGLGQSIRSSAVLDPSMIPLVVGPGILIVDSHPESLRSRVAGSGMNVDVVDAEGARRRFMTESFDCVFIDADMEGPDDGFGLARELRLGPSGREVPLAFYASNPTMTQRLAAVHAGAGLFLDKPLSRARVRGAADELMAQAGVDSTKVLLVEDDEDFAAHMIATLESNGMAAFHLKDPHRLLEALASQRPDLVLLDVMMPEVSGLDLCRTIRSTPEWRDLLILFVSAQPSAEIRLACFEAGGDDYLQKPVLKQELLARTRVRLERQRLLRERMERDYTTGLLNRRAFINEFGPRLLRSQQERQPVSIALLDLDQFKAINDHHGHLMGDRVLTALGKLLEASFRPYDLRARWGGEEFLLAFDEQQAAGVQKIVERTLVEFSGMSFIDDAGEAFRVTFSAGVAEAPADGASLEELLRVADLRLYGAKAAGRARVISQSDSTDAIPSSD